MSMERIIQPRSVDVAAVLTWCAETGHPPHRNFVYSVYVTNAAGRLWNDWENYVPEMRSEVLRRIAKGVIDGTIKEPMTDRAGEKG